MSVTIYNYKIIENLSDSKIYNHLSKNNTHIKVCFYCHQIHYWISIYTRLFHINTFNEHNRQLRVDFLRFVILKQIKKQLKTVYKNNMTQGNSRSFCFNGCVFSKINYRKVTEGLSMPSWTCSREQDSS